MIFLIGDLEKNHSFAVLTFLIEVFKMVKKTCVQALVVLKNNIFPYNVK